MENPEHYLRQRNILFTPLDEVYHQSRKVFNGLIGELPAFVVKPLSVEDVRAAVILAKEEGLQVTVKCGGHGAYGHSVRDGCLLIDMNGYDSIDIASERVTVGGGVLSGDLDRALAPYFKAIPLGDCPGVGVAGIALGGGNGFLSRKYGFTCDSIISCSMVSATGELVEITDSTHPELLWAMRGGGQCNFGIVTDIQFQLHPVPEEVVTGSIYFPLSGGQSVFNAFLKMVNDAPSELSIFLRVNSELAQTPCVRVYGLYHGLIEEGFNYFQTIESWSSPLHSAIRAGSYCEAQRINASSIGEDISFHWQSGVFNVTPTGEVWELIRTCYEKCPNTLGRINYDPLGGAVRQPGKPSAFAYREKAGFLSVIGTWRDPGEETSVHEWVEESYKSLAQLCHPSARYVNYADSTSNARLYFGDNTEKLLELKDVWDPENIFRGLL